MKTYHQFFEDIEQRRQELSQRQKEQMQRLKEKSKSYEDSKRQRELEDADRRQIIDAIKREVQSGN